jgi:tRNA dimethylallyltransferase
VPPKLEHGSPSSDARQLPLVAVIGATGSGKSSLALDLAQNFQGEIVNCDSLQVYRHFDLGTAKLPVTERRGIPHHMIDIVDPDEVFTAGAYAQQARAAIADISARGRVPIVAGGTGFYLRALLSGLSEGPARDQALRDRLATREKRRAGSLYRLLGRFDPRAARRIHPHDVPKVARALEVFLLARRPLTELFEKGRNALAGYRTLKIGLWPDREALYQRLDRRCHQMFEEGLTAEVRRILDLGFAPTSKPFESHGYRQALRQLRGELTPKEALFYAQRNTRRYAKRQMTWFRQEPATDWLHGFGDDALIRQAAADRVATFMAAGDI